MNRLRHDWKRKTNDFFSTDIHQKSHPKYSKIEDFKKWNYSNWCVKKLELEINQMHIGITTLHNHLMYMIMNLFLFPPKSIPK